MWWVDAQAGASGDMLLGALLDLFPEDLPVAQSAVDEVLTALGHPGAVRLGHHATTRAGLRAHRATVDCQDTDSARQWTDIRSVLPASSAYVTFERLARAEAYVHSIDIDGVHFHEVGALDAIADIVACTALIERHRPAQVVVSAVAVGSGLVQTAHGQLPVPAPAVVELLRGVPTFAGPIAHEACTPTGAALLVAMATAFGPQPAMTTERVGVGAGGRDPGGSPNVVRIFAGRPGDSAAQILVLEATIDDLDPRVYPFVQEQLRHAGAVETWLTPVIMKHGRPAVTLTALVPPRCREAAAAAVFTHTTTLGVRWHVVDRDTLDRDWVTVSVHGLAVRVKRGSRAGAVVTMNAEYRDCEQVARATGIPVREVLRVAHELARGQEKGPDATDGGDSDVRTVES